MPTSRWGHAALPWTTARGLRPRCASAWWCAPQSSVNMQVMMAIPQVMNDLVCLGCYSTRFGLSRPYRPSFPGCPRKAAGWMGSGRPAVQRVHRIDDRGDSRTTTECLSVNTNGGRLPRRGVSKEAAISCKTEEELMSGDQWNVEKLFPRPLDGEAGLRSPTVGDSRPRHLFD
jgi:hypothetical protein